MSKCTQIQSRSDQIYTLSEQSHPSAALRAAGGWISSERVYIWSLRDGIWLYLLNFDCFLPWPESVQFVFHNSLLLPLWWIQLLIIAYCCLLFWGRTDWVFTDFLLLFDKTLSVDIFSEKGMFFFEFVDPPEAIPQPRGQICNFQTETHNCAHFSISENSSDFSIWVRPKFGRHMTFSTIVR